ncbi:TetR/AcrR family transcriptional regulator [Neorhizobium sp. DT-125]|uniref:TetR/AcrR family transcriptional regulator n=1 Tax=Neorhizobium sp. DT-125 TaxID=3396163 RepID=UPI003F1DECF0
MSKPIKMRADAARNRERLITIAKARFAAGDTDVKYDVLARESGVGIGTLYRHFPTRHALVEAVYEAEMDALDSEADALFLRHQPLQAMRMWMDRYAAFVTTKHAMMDALRAAVMANGRPEPQTRSRIHAQIARFVDAGVQGRTIREDADSENISLAMAGIVLAATTFQAPERLHAMLDVLIDGIERRPSEAEPAPAEDAERSAIEQRF